MALQYDINKIFAELEQQARKKSKKHEKVDPTKENDPIESPEDAPQTQEVAPATSKTTEDTHGGDEASKEIKDSPNSVDGGENPDKENKSKKTKNTGENGKGDGQGEEEKKKFVQKLYRKLESGKKLSADEMQYLRKNDPVTYAKAAKVQVLRESLKKQLKSATSKEKAADIYTQAMSRISEDDPARKEIMAAYDDVYKEFRKSDEYKALPNTEKEAKEKAANNKNKNAQGWEEKEDDDTEMSVGEIDVVEKLM